MLLGVVWPSQLPVCEVRPGGGPGLALTGSPDAASCGGAAAATLLDVVSKVGTLTGGALTGGALAGGTALTGPGAGALAEGCLAGALGRFFLGRTTASFGAHSGVFFRFSSVARSSGLGSIAGKADTDEVLQFNAKSCH